MTEHHYEVGSGRPEGESRVSRWKRTCAGVGVKCASESRSSGGSWQGSCSPSQQHSKGSSKQASTFRRLAVGGSGTTFTDTTRLAQPERGASTAKRSLRHTERGPIAAWPGWTSGVVSESPSKPATPTPYPVKYPIHCFSLSKLASPAYVVSGRTSTSEEERARQIQEEVSISCLSLSKDASSGHVVSGRTRMSEEERA